MARERQPAAVAHFIGGARAGRRAAAAPAPAPPPASAARRASRRGEIADGRHRLSAAEPGIRKPFVEIGSIVKAGDKILLVEAMKTYNEIVAPRAGKVTHIFVEDGSPVEYDQPLMVIE